MAARWVGLTRPHIKKRFRSRAVAHTFKHCVHALGAGGVLVLAAAMNFALYPDALAAVVSGERPIVGFVPAEPAGRSVSESEPVVVDETDVRLLAATVWGEARSEGEDGMRAVAHVMVNRIGDRFGEDLGTVILSPKQFSVWNRGDPNRRIVQNLARDPSRIATDVEWLTAERVAREVLGGQSVDPTGGALFYHTRGVRPRWARVGEGRQVIGQHIFYTDVPDPGRRSTPRLIDVAQFLGQALPGGGERRAAGTHRGAARWTGQWRHSVRAGECGGAGTAECKRGDRSKRRGRAHDQRRARCDPRCPSTPPRRSAPIRRQARRN